MRALLLVFFLAATGLGCRIRPIVDLKDEAPVRVLEKPSLLGSATSFGNILVTKSLDRTFPSETARVSRLAIGSAPGQPFGYYTGWSWDAAQSDAARRPMLDLDFQAAYCEDIDPDDRVPCDAEQHSAALAILDTWDFDGSGAAEPDQGCVASTSYFDETSIRRGDEPAEGGGRVRIRCETAGTAIASQRAPVGSGFGASMTIVKEGDHDETALLVGATGNGGPANNGRLFRLRRDVNVPEALPLPPAMPALGESDRFGALLAAHSSALPEGTLGAAGQPALVVVGVPEDEEVPDRSGRVFAMALGMFDDDADPMTPETLGLRMVACIDEVVMRREGGALALGGQGFATGDVDGDGAPEIYVGGANEVRWLEVAPGLSAATGCAMPSAVDDGTTTIPCPAADADVSCASARFGADLAVGDIDHDGTADLVVGAPDATVLGKTRSGAVWVLRGSDTGPVVEGARVLYPSEPAAEARLGAQVEILQTQLVDAASIRDEVAAGAPGAGEVYVFLCSGFPGDEPQGGDRCLPVLQR